jgi:hypothetical protein
MRKENMNWKFWTWPEQIRRLRAELESGEDYVNRASEVRRENDILKARLEAVYHRTPAPRTPAAQDAANRERWITLSEFEPSHALWQEVLKLADEAERFELDAALGPNLSDGTRQYNAGRAAAASSFASNLRDQMSLAQMRAQKVEKLKS